jgi:hypothetical protein
VVLCQQLGLFSEALVAIDGSKFKAGNNRDRNFTRAKLQRRMEEIESSINRTLPDHFHPYICRYPPMNYWNSLEQEPTRCLMLSFRAPSLPDGYRMRRPKQTRH